MPTASEIADRLRAAQKFIQAPRHGEVGEWKEISPAEIPDNVQKRFAEYAE